MDITDLDMELKITNITELEEGVEYYVIFINKDMVKHNGIYILYEVGVNIIHDRFGSLIKTDNNNVKLGLYYAINMLSGRCKFSTITDGWCVECSLFKMPTNEYVLK
jgi:hypothetical protein